MSFLFALVFTAQDVLIYLFGESAVHLTVEGLGSVSVQELGRSVREALHIPESAQDAFAFWLCSPLLGKELFEAHFLIPEILVLVWETYSMSMLICI